MEVVSHLHSRNYSWILVWVFFPLGFCPLASLLQAVTFLLPKLKVMVMSFSLCTNLVKGRIIKAELNLVLVCFLFFGNKSSNGL